MCQLHYFFQFLLRPCEGQIKWKKKNMREFKFSFETSHTENHQRKCRFRVQNKLRLKLNFPVSQRISGARQPEVTTTHHSAASSPSPVFPSTSVSRARSSRNRFHSQTRPTKSRRTASGWHRTALMPDFTKYFTLYLRYH